MTLRYGEYFAGCRIIAICGHGAFGTVYLAENAIGRQVAIKIFDSLEAEKRELKGIQNYMRLNFPSAPSTPSLITIHHAGLDQGHLYYVMDLADNASNVPGQYLPDTLARRLKAAGPLGRFPLDEAVKICLTLLDGMETMHQAGLLHRDIKPENILFIQGKPVLGDPGGAGDFTHTLSVTGTLGFIPPELLHGKSKPAPTADIYALGKVLYVAITGNPPEEFPDMPQDLELDTLVRVCQPLAHLCNVVPENRCQSCADCRRLLLEINHPHGRLWTLWHRWQADALWRRRIFIRLAAVLAVLLCVALGVGYGWHRHQTALHQAQVRTEAEQEECSRLLTTWQQRLPKLLVQLEEEKIILPIEKQLQEIRQLAKEKRTPEALDRLRDLEASLEQLAIDHLPQDRESAPLADRLEANARVFGYLSSPLGKWFLPESRQREAKSKAEAEAKSLAAAGGFQKVVNGEAFQFGHGVILRFQFLPPGQFKSPVTGKIERIDQPFWMLSSELSYKQMMFLSQALTRKNLLLEMPATQLGWNDFISLCIYLNKSVSQECGLPPGYGFRPPTEAEWEYAALGGMAGSPLKPEKILSHEAVAPELAAPANEFGLQNLDRNVSEMVAPYPGHHREDWAIIRGANFQARTTNIENREDVRLDQISLAYIGFRPVLAPITKTYYEDAWHTVRHLRTAVVEGKAYVDIENCAAFTSWQEANKMAKALGARLVEPRSFDHLRSIFDALQADDRYYTHAGIRFQDGAWRTISDGLPSPLASKLLPPAPDSPRVFTSAMPKNIMSIAGNMKMPMTCLEYPDVKSFESRPRPPLEDEFEIDGRHFGLLKFVLTGYMVQAFLDFAGYQSPIIHDKELLAKVQEHLKDFDEKIALGLQMFGVAWCWRDRSPLAEGVKVDLTSLDKQFLANKNYSVVVIQNGQLQANFYCDAILVEL